MVNIANIPHELAARDQWVVWRLEARKAGDKPTKVPYNARTGHKAESDNPATWSSFDAAVKAYEAGGYTGIGYVFSVDDPFTGVDFDDCVTEDCIATWARGELTTLNSYSEISPSGTGIKTIVRGSVEKNMGDTAYQDGAVAIFNRGKFFAITGQVLPEFSTEIRDVNGELPALRDRVQQYKAQQHTTRLNVTPANVSHVLTPTAAAHLHRWASRKKTEALEIIANASDGEKHGARIRAARLYAGLIPHGLATASEAEAAVYNANIPKSNDKSELQTIRDAIANGAAEPLELPEPPREPVFDAAGVACCPDGHGPLIKSHNGNGWRCERVKCFWWAGEGYSPFQQASDTQEDTPPRRRWLTEDEIELIKPPTWLIKGVIAAGEVTMIAGAGDAGKTFLAVDMMKRVAQHYRVLYVAAEDAPGVGIRKKGWDIHHNRTANGNFLLWHEPFSLFNAEQMDSFIAEIRPLGLQMITIDTLSQASVGADENSSNDMGVVMANAQRLAHETGAAVAVLHHNTKDNANYRGSSVIKNNTYGFLEVSKENDVIRLECNRIKNTKSFEPRFFRLIDVATTTLDTEGQPVSTAVIVPAERVLRIGDELTQSEHKMLELVLAATDAMGGITTTELATELQMKGKSFYSPLKRLRDLRFIEKAGDKRTDPLTITPAGRSKMARTDTVNAVQPAGGAAAPLFEVNTNLAELLPLLPLLPASYPTEKDMGSNHDSRGSNYPVATPAESDDQQSCYPVATLDEAALQAVATLATPVATPALGSNGVVTTPPSPPLRGKEGSNSQHQPPDMNKNAVQPAGGARARGPIQNVGQTYNARREIMALGDPRSLKELALLPEPELYALLDRMRAQTCRQEDDADA